MKERFIQEAMRLKALPAWVRGLLLIIFILLIYQVFLEISFFLDGKALGACPDCTR
ncbi:MAG: hypothetical protein FD189_1817 [Elusimicrobia bacterium]|nr:MAG: hypothetical protein FD154_1960 [Elusimicrobiota bacterium]KAF0154565.1 MAG: hypothetical protein FD189_1817 [Elusimicrobiota bacterium]